MERIVHWTIKVTWEDTSKLKSGSIEKPYMREEYLEDIPQFKDVENYLDELEADRNKVEED